MKAKSTPPTHLVPARDPMLDTGRARQLWAIVRRWSPGIFFALALLSTQAKLAEWDAQVDAAESQRESANARADLEILRNAHLHRTASGCSRLYYLVEGDVGESLMRAQMALDDARLGVLDARRGTAP